jgi:hypothetical protein
VAVFGVFPSPETMSRGKAQSAKLSGRKVLAFSKDGHSSRTARISCCSGDKPLAILRLPNQAVTAQPFELLRGMARSQGFAQPE